MSQMSDSELLTKFTQLAREFGAAVRDSDSVRAQHLAPEFRAVQDELRARGRDTRLKLVPLLDTKDRLVRYYAAKHLFALCPDRAREIFEENAKFSFDPICADARMGLRMIDSGEFSPS